MIGWRPYLFTGLAILLLAVAALDVANTRRPTPPCATADGLRTAGMLARADRAYASVLRDDAKSPCATRGRDAVSTEQCKRMRAIGAVDPREQRRLLLALAAADPRPDEHSCVWAELSASPPAAKVAG
jgi:hypothetical protein